MSWDEDAAKQPDKPFSDKRERQEIRLSTEHAKRWAERTEHRDRLLKGAKRWFIWLASAFAFVVGASQLPEAIAKLVRLFGKGGI